MIRDLLFILIFIPLISFSQDIAVKGNVVNSEGVLPGVNVIEKGTNNGTTTNFEGEYTLKVKNDAILVFSSLGFKTQEISVNGKSVINLTLQEDAAQLGEVVIKGFAGVIGQARRRSESVQSTPESVVTFTSETIETKGITNIQTFSDQIPNVNFTTSQNVGNNFITVRGISHIRNGE